MNQQPTLTREDETERPTQAAIVTAAIHKHGLPAVSKALQMNVATVARVAGDLPRSPMTDSCVAMRLNALAELDRHANAKAEAEAAATSKSEP